MVKRDLTKIAKEYSKYFSVIAIVGPRQSGKTTFSKATFKEFEYKNLEEPDTLEFANDDPRNFLDYSGKGLIIDEIQRLPKLFSYIQAIVDNNKHAKFVLTGSQNFLLFEKITQTLAGRIGILKLLPFSNNELKINSKTNLSQTIFTGAYPPIYDKKIPPNIWLPNYIQTYVDRDVRQIKNISDYSLFVKFVKLCAGRVGQLLNFTSISNEIGLAVNTVKSWISILETSFIVTLLKPYHKNYNKRIVKSPKLYFIDTGLASSLLSINEEIQVDSHFAKGALFENLVITELIKFYYNRGIEAPIYYWRDKTGREIDCIIETNKKIHALEIKSSTTPNISFTKNIEYWNLLTNNSPVNSHVIYGGNRIIKNKNATFSPWFRLQNIIS